MSKYKNHLEGQDQYIDVVRNISLNPVSGLVSSPYSGKTTELAILLSKLNLEQGGKQIMVVKQNDLSMMFNYNDAKFRQDKGVVGYASFGNEKYKNSLLNDSDSDEYSALVYTTPFFLASKMLELYSKRNNYHFCNLIIVDDANCNTIENNLLLFVWQEMFKSKKPVPRLLLTSCHHEMIDFLPEYPIKTIDINYPRVIYGLKQTVAVASPEKYEHLHKLIRSYHLKNPLDSNLDDVWVVFLPSESEIFRCFKALSDLDLELIRVWSVDMNNPDTRKLKNPLISGKRRIILTNEVGESCFLPCSMVFDSMEYSLAPKKISTISKSKAHQRGVNATQLILRHISEQDFTRKTLNVTPKEVKISDLTKISLYMITNNADYSKFFKICGVDSKVIDDNNKNLATLSIVNYNKSVQGYELTDAGRFVYNKNIPVKECLVLYKWTQKENEGPRQMLAFVSFLEYGFVQRWNDDLEKVMQDHFPEILRLYPQNDVVLNLCIYTFLVKEINSFDCRNNKKTFIDLCKSLDLDVKKTTEVFENVNSVADSLGMSSTEILENDSLLNLLKKCDKWVVSVFRTNKLAKTGQIGNRDCYGDNMVWYKLRARNKHSPQVIYNLGETLMKDSNYRMRSVIRHVYVPMIKE